MDLVALAAIAGGADAVAMAKAARAADWRALGWKAEKLVLQLRLTSKAQLISLLPKKGDK